MLPSNPEPLIVDVSSSQPLEDSEVRAWAAHASVFISSVIAGMTAEREAVVAAVEAVGATAVLFEAFGGMDDDAEDAYIGRVAASDIYVGVLGPRYGTPMKTGYAASHAEYNEAERRGRRISVWVTTDELDGRQRDFLEEVRVFHTTGAYASPEDLRQRVERRLREIAADAVSPWVKIGNTVVRALSVRDDGARISVSARVRDSHAAASIELRRPDRGFGRDTETRLTWPGGTATVRISTVEVETTSSGARMFTVAAERSAATRNTLVDIALGSRTPEEVTEAAMRVALFGEPNSLGDLGFMAQIENPLAGLDRLVLPEDAISQIAQLLVTEALVGGGRAEYVTSFRLGPVYRHQRQLELAWMSRRRYTNVEPEERRIEGVVAWGG